MPKKFQGMNSKAVTAKARKAEKLHSEQEQKQREMEDSYWRDDDKNSKKKQQRKEAQENKRLEAASKKKELQDLYQAEQNSLSAVAKNSNLSKVTRADIHEMGKKERDEQDERKKAEAFKKKNISVQSDEIVENINKLVIEGSEARTVEEAISVLGNSSEDLDRHPERRLKSSYRKFEQERTPILKAQHPDMRLSQLRQILRKEWQKSPENPLNQKHLEYNEK